MKCGQAVFAKNTYGAVVLRFIGQCDGRFIVVASNVADHRNGYMLPDWRAVLRELVGLCVPAKLAEQTLTAEGAGIPEWVCFPLTYPLAVSGFARLLGVPADDVREQLSDLAVPLEV